MRESRPELFRGRHFRDEIIVLCVRWYLRYPLSYRNLEEMMTERGLRVGHSTIARWVLRYAPVLNERIRAEMRNPNRSWQVDETYIRFAGRWTFSLSPYRATTATKAFLQLANCTGWAHPASRPQCGWTRGVPGGSGGTEKLRGSPPHLPMSPVAVHEQHS
jgi:hypothetical protein